MHSLGKVVRWLAAGGVVSSAASSGCATPQRPRPTIALVVRGEPRAPIETAAAKADLGVDVRVVQAPHIAASTRATQLAGAQPTAAEVEERLAAARADYLSGELLRVRSCAERLGDPALVWSSIARRSRATAGRVLLWRIACTSIARREDAVDAAATFAALDLELPSEVEAIPVEAHKILTVALHDAEAAGKRELSVRATGDGRPVVTAQVIIDGRAACTTDCVVTVAPGDHLVQVEKNGWADGVRTVRVTSGAPRTETVLALATAPPDLAGAQWAATYAALHERADANESIALLAQALRARSFVYMEADPLGGGVRIRGVLAVHGKVEAREERQGAVDTTSRDVLAALLLKGGIVENKSVFKSPLFWVAAGAVAIASSALTAYLLYHPGSRTEVRTR